MERNQGLETTMQDWQMRFTRWLEVEWVSSDAAHDLGHLERVWRNAREIAAGEGQRADELTLLAASFFHDVVTIAKDHPDRSRASVLSAEKFAELQRSVFTDFPETLVAGVQHAIAAHSFSANIPATTIEAKILQDADRIEALGALGIARLFYTAGKMNSQLFHPTDPKGTKRKLDDRNYALDHIELKLLRLPETMQTATGKKLADERARQISIFRTSLLAEIELVDDTFSNT
jgi:uncharacterized protein